MMKAVRLGIVLCVTSIALAACSSSERRAASAPPQQRQEHHSKKVVHSSPARIDKPIIADFAILRVGQHVLTGSERTFCTSGAHWIHYDQVDRYEPGCSARPMSVPAKVIAIGNDSHHSDSRVILLVEVSADDSSWSAWTDATSIVPLLPPGTSVTIAPFDGQVTQPTVRRAIGGPEKDVPKGTEGTVIRQGSGKHEDSVLIHFVNGTLASSDGWVDIDELRLRGSLIVLDHMESRSEGTSYYNTASNSAYPKPAAAIPAPDPTFVVSSTTDFWETDSLMCNGYRQAAEGLVTGTRVDVASLDGYHQISAGTHVKVTRHRSGYCPGTTKPRFDLTFVTVDDASSDLNGTSGVIQEGLLAKG